MVSFIDEQRRAISRFGFVISLVEAVGAKIVMNGNIALLQLGFLLTTAAVPAAAQVRPSGIWDVIGARIDMTTARRQAFEIDDPRLVGRSIEFAADSVKTSLDEGGCQHPAFVARSEPIDVAFAKVFGTTQDGAPHTTSDFGIPPATMKNAKMWMVKCDLGGGYYDDGIPLILLQDDKALLGWNDFAILRLQRRSDKAVPVPSFSCHDVRSLPEKTICASVDLSNIDASLNGAFRETLKTLKRDEPDKVSQLLSSQRKWLTRREQCGATHDCLLDLMRKRTQELIDLRPE